MQKRVCAIGLFISMMMAMIAACSKQTLDSNQLDTPELSSTMLQPASTQTEISVGFGTETSSSTPRPQPSSTPNPTIDPFTFTHVNVTEMTILKRLGGPPAGRIDQIIWSVDGRWMLVLGQDQLLLYDTGTLSLQWRRDKPQMAVFIGAGDEYAALVGDQLDFHLSADGNMLRSVEINDLHGDRFLVSPNGRYLAAQTLENQINCWELDEGEMIQVVDLDTYLEMDSESITGMTFSQDGSYLYAATFAGGIYQISVESGEVKRIIQAAFVPDLSISSNTPDECYIPGANGYYLVVLCVHYIPSADGSTIASSRYTLKWVDLNNGDLLQTTFEIKNSYQRISLSPDGESLIMLGVGEFTRLQLQSESIQFTQVPMCLNHSSDPFFTGPTKLNLVAVIDGYETGEFFSCDVVSGEKQVSLDFEPPSSVAVGITGESYQIAAGSCAGLIDLWDPYTDQISASIQAHEGCINDLDFSSDGIYLASGAADGLVALWDLGTDATQPIFTYSHPDSVLDLVLNSDGSQVASISKQLVQLWDRTSEKKLFERQLESGRSITFGFDHWMAYADRDYVYWDQLDNLNTDHIVDTGNLIFDPESRYLASSYPRGDRVWFFDVDSSDQLYVMDVSAMNVLSIGFSPDGCVLVGIPEHREFRFWKTSPIDLIGTVDTGINLENRVVDAEISPDRHLIVMGTLDGSILVWGLNGALTAPVGLAGSRAVCGMVTAPSATSTTTPSATSEPTSIPSTATSVPFIRNLYLTTPNLEGPDVLALQKRLLDLGYSQVGVADGIFGPLTDHVVRQFQQDHGLVVDGVVGPKTWALLFGTSE